MTTKERMQKEGETNYFIQFPSGNYFMDQHGSIIYETPILKKAGYRDTIEGVKQTLRQIEKFIPPQQMKELTVFGLTRYPLVEEGDVVPPFIMSKGIELERKYIVCNLGDYCTYSEGRYSSKKTPGYSFYSGEGLAQSGGGNYLYSAHLYNEKEVAEDIAKMLEKEAFKRRAKRIVWSVMEVVIIKIEVKL